MKTTESPQIKVTQERCDTSSLLLCPCGGSYLHHAGVVVRHRHREDSKTARVTTIDGAAVRTVDESPDVGAGRRGSITVSFWCEICGRAGLDLLIEQHKGETFLSWNTSMARPTLADDRTELE